LGGVDALTGTQRVLLAQLRRCLIFLALIDRWLADREFIDKAGNLAAPMNAFYLAALNSSTRICKDLGLERKAPAESLEKYLENKAKEAQTLPAKGKTQAGKGAKECARSERKGGGE
jgi:hypothetical protein